MAFSLIHISDLHFGCEISPRNSRGPAAIAPASTPVIQGLSPHDLGACEDLTSTLRLLVRKHSIHSEPMIVVSGDLTVSGDDSEFALALSFLRGEVHTRLTSTIGLRDINTSEILSVPGNHDHWRRALLAPIVQPGNPPRLQGAFVTGVPGETWWSRVFEASPNTGLVLHILGLDSCGGVGPRAFAKGKIASNAISAVAGEINHVDSVFVGRPIVRALVLHHSLYQAQGGVVSQLNGWLHSLEPQSEHELQSLINTGQIHCLLTGHLHHERLPVVPANTPPFGLEFRCGTTLQYLPPRPAGQFAGQSFLVHEIREVSGRPVWETTVFKRVASQGFLPQQRLSPIHF